MYLVPSESLVQHKAFSNAAYDVPTHAIAPRVISHSQKPHIGPDMQAYRIAHADSVLDNSTTFWATVSDSHGLMSLY